MTARPFLCVLLSSVVFASGCSYNPVGVYLYDCRRPVLMNPDAGVGRREVGRYEDEAVSSRGSSASTGTYQSGSSAYTKTTTSYGEELNDIYASGVNAALGYSGNRAVTGLKVHVCGWGGMWIFVFYSKMKMKVDGAVVE
ncbi:MAG: hypothetical protein ACYS8L_04205 [Planctomycetota bacterium]|jgi:hypothetical protein